MKPSYDRRSKKCIQRTKSYYYRNVADFKAFSVSNNSCSNKLLLTNWKTLRLFHLTKWNSLLKWRFKKYQLLLEIIPTDTLISFMTYEVWALRNLRNFIREAKLWPFLNFLGVSRYLNLHKSKLWIKRFSFSRTFTWNENWQIWIIKLIKSTVSKVNI